MWKPKIYLCWWALRVSFQLKLSSIFSNEWRNAYHHYLVYKCRCQKAIIEQVINYFVSQNSPSHWGVIFKSLVIWEHNRIKSPKKRSLSARAFSTIKGRVSQKLLYSVPWIWTWIGKMMWIKTAAVLLLSLVCLSSAAYRTEEQMEDSRKVLQFLGKHFPIFCASEIDCGKFQRRWKKASFGKLETLLLPDSGHNCLKSFWKWLQSVPKWPNPKLRIICKCKNYRYINKYLFSLGLNKELLAA